jgi:hypothetical protein
LGLCRHLLLYRHGITMRHGPSLKTTRATSQYGGAHDGFCWTLQNSWNMSSLRLTEYNGKRAALEEKIRSPYSLDVASKTMDEGRSIAGWRLRMAVTMTNRQQCERPRAN